MNRLSALSFRQKLLLGCYSILGLFSLCMLILLLLDASLLVGLIAVVILLAASYPILNMIDRSLSAPIKEISYSAIQVAKGDFSQKLQVNADDVVGDLGHTFNRMVEQLRQILQQTTDLSRHVSDSGRDMYLKNQNMKLVMEQVAASSNELAVGSSEISEDIAGMTESMKEIEDRVASYAHSTKEMNERGIQTLALVHKGRSAIDTQTEGMKRNVEATEQVAETISELARQANGISKITRSISEIAEQTNLLSLNASIEAARAGEHGLGFAIVAQEVRKLAEESSSMTKEVFTLVKGIEQGIQQALVHIKKNEDVVYTQTTMIQETERIFKDIVGSVQFITDQITNFANESDLMLEHARNISSSIENISAITEESAAGTEQVSASMNEQIHSVQSMLESTEELQQKVLQLQRIIQVFKL